MGIERTAHRPSSKSDEIEICERFVSEKKLVDFLYTLLKIRSSRFSSLNINSYFLNKSSLLNFLSLFSTFWSCKNNV